MIEIGKRFNRRVIATLSSMNENLGYAIGNSLEIIEAIETLKGNGPLDFTELSLTLASNTIKALGITDSFNDAYNLAKSKIDDGSALLVFKELVKLLGGDISYIEDTNKFIKPKYIIPIYSKSKGYVSYVDTKLLGTISMLIGGGRIKKDDKINHSVGLKFYPKIGTYLNIGDKVSDLYIEELNEDIVNMILNAFKLSDEKVNFELILDTNL
jgi:pyrimidine-nucleoside phosphorylase